MRAQLVRQLFGEAAQHRFLEPLPRNVVGFAALLGTRHRVGDHLWLQHQLLAVDIEHLFFGGHLLPGPDALRDDLRHLGRALERRNVGGVFDGGVDAGIQLPHARQHNTGFTQRREYRFDVLEKRGRRTHNQHTSRFQTFTVGVQKKRGTVQRHGRFTRAGTTLNNKHTGEVGTDDAVLLCLDGGDDVTHPSSSFCAQGGEKCALTLKIGRVTLEQVTVEDLVLDTRDFPTLAGQVASRPGSERSRCGRLVKRARLRHSPVEEDGELVFVAQADAPDVPVDPIGQLQPTEGQALVDFVELRDAVGVDARKGIALGPVLVGTSGIGPAHRIQLLLSLYFERVEARIERRYVFALAR